LCADVAGRCEPGTGEIHYLATADALRDSVAALAAFRAAFTRSPRREPQRSTSMVSK
jgi:hypothetical protein